MAETFICIRGLQKITAFPISVNPPTVGYIVIYIVGVQILVSLFCAVMHPSGTSRQIRVVPDIKIHLLFPCHENVMYADILVNRKPVNI